MSGRLPMDREVSQALVGMLEDVGFTVDMNILEWAAYREITAAREHPDIYLGSGSNSLWDAYLALWGLRYSWDTRLPEYPEGTIGWANHEFDQLVLAASTEMNPDRRYDMYVEAGRMVAEERPHIYLYQLKNAYGVSDNLDWQPRVDQMFWMYGASSR